MLHIDQATYRSPNHDARPGAGRITAIVLHSCEGRLPDPRRSSIPWLINPQSQVSCHYYVCRDGTVYQLVDDERRAWHAGRGQLGLDTDLNDVSLGIECEHRAGQDWPAAQQTALSRLVLQLMRSYQIRPERVVSHRAVAQPRGRKSDPTDWTEREIGWWLAALVAHG